MGIAREIAQHFLWSAEWAFAVDHPLAIAQWREIGSKGLALGQWGVLAEELQLAGGVSGDEFFEESSAEQSRQHAHRKKEAGSTGNPAFAVGGEAAAWHDHVHVRMVSER